MSEKKEVAIWIPLRPGSSWRGEGIAQTIENIVTHLPKDVLCNIVVSHEHAVDLGEVIKDYSNIKVVKFGFSLFKKSRYEITESSNFKVSLLQLVLSKIKVPFVGRFDGSLKNIRYISTLFFYTQLQRCGLFLPQCGLFWFPSPIIPFSEKLSGKKIFSFWDPFVFEYREFSDIAKVLYKRFYGLYKSADLVTTQSEANKSFLVGVFKLPAEKIMVINNGSPDFSKYLPSLEKAGRRNAEHLLRIWGSVSYFAESYKAAMEKLLKDNINKSILWRLLYKANHQNECTVMVSTQLRPYKGFGILFEVLDRLVKTESAHRYQFIFTSDVPPTIKDKYPVLYERIHEINRVSNKQLAQLYYMADLVLHPSYVEGGLGVYPQFEAASVGTPALVNIGRHVYENGQKGNDNVPPLTSADFVDVEATVCRIEQLATSQEEREANINESRQLAIEWSESSKKYAEIFKGLSNA